MAISDPPITSYSDVTAHKQVISDYISLIDPSDVPVVSYFGLEGDPGKFALQNWPGPAYTWLEDDLAALADALGANVADTDVVTITVVDATKFHNGHIILADAEQMWVSAVNTTTNVLTVTRNYGGTLATHASDGVVTIIGMARLEGDDSDDDYKTDVVTGDNYTQIFQAGIKVSRTMSKISQWGIAGEYEYQRNKKVPELSRLIEKAFFLGQGKAGSATTPRAFYGVIALITTNTSTLSTAALTRDNLEDAVQTCWNYGGKPDLIICGAWVRRKISSFYEASVRTERSESRGGVVIDFIETHFGTLQVLMSRWCPTDHLFILESDHVGFLAFDPFFSEPLAKDGDYERGEVLGEFGFVLRNEKAHAYIKGISITS